MDKTQNGRKAMKHISPDIKLLLSERSWFLQKDQNNMKIYVTISSVFRFYSGVFYYCQLI